MEGVTGRQAGGGMAQGDERGQVQVTEACSGFPEGFQPSSLRMRMVAGKGTCYSLLEKRRVMVTVFGSSVGQRENNAAPGPLALKCLLATAARAGLNIKELVT